MDSYEHVNFDSVGGTLGSHMTFARAPDTPVTLMEMWAKRRIDTYSMPCFAKLI